MTDNLYTTVEETTFSTSIRVHEGGMHITIYHDALFTNGNVASVQLGYRHKTKAVFPKNWFWF